MRLQNLIVTQAMITFFPDIFSFDDNESEVGRMENYFAVLGFEIIIALWFPIGHLSAGRHNRKEVPG